MPTLLQIASLHPDAQARLEVAYQLLRAELQAIDDAWLAAHGQSVEGIVTGGHLGVPPALMTALPNLKVIGINGVGYDKIDLDLARSRSVRVANTPRRADRGCRRPRDRPDLVAAAPAAACPCARPGRALAVRRPPARHQAERQADRYLRPWPDRTRGRQAVRRFHRHHRLYRRCAAADVADPTCPMRSRLPGLRTCFVICAAAAASDPGVSWAGRCFDALGPGGVLVNVARGSIVDRTGAGDRIAGGAVSAVPRSTCSRDEPNVPAALRGMENVITTPHIASATHETRRAMGDLMIDNLDAFFAGRPMPTPVV